MPTTSIRRRSLVQGAAWATPAVVIASSAPTVAASVRCAPGCPTGSFGGGLNLNGWSISSVGTFAQGANQRLGFYSSYTPWPGTDTCTGVTGGSVTTLSNVIVAEADPRAASPTPTVTYSKQFCLVAGVTYTFTFSWNSYNINSRSETLQALIRDALGNQVALIGGAVTAAGKTNNKAGTVSGSFTPSVTGTYTYEYRWTFGSTPASYTDACVSGTNGGLANDIAVTAPTISCSPTP